MCKLNHCKSTAIQCIVIVLNDVSSKSCEQILITKEHIAMHTNLITVVLKLYVVNEFVF